MVILSTTPNLLNQLTSVHFFYGWVIGVITVFHEWFGKQSIIRLLFYQNTWLGATLSARMYNYFSHHLLLFEFNWFHTEWNGKIVTSNNEM